MNQTYFKPFNQQIQHILCHKQLNVAQPVVTPPRLHETKVCSTQQEVSMARAISSLFLLRREFVNILKMRMVHKTLNGQRNKHVHGCSDTTNASQKIDDSLSLITLKYYVLILLNHLTPIRTDLLNTEIYRQIRYLKLGYLIQNFYQLS